MVWLVTAALACEPPPPYERYNQPPAPRSEAAVPRPGYIWIHGRWIRHGGTWTWRDGQYEAERPGYEYIQGRWEKRGEYYVWIEGEWRPVR